MSNYSVSVSSNVPTNVPINFITNAGTAVSSSNNINVVGSGGTSTSGSGNTVTITSTSGAMTWTDENTSFAVTVNNGYFCTAALTATLPASPSQGNLAVFETTSSGSIVIKANTGQFINLGSGTSSSAGTATSSAVGNSLYLVYRSASSTWHSISTEGTWLLA